MTSTWLARNNRFTRSTCLQESRAVEWEEPEFSDNVGVTSVMASQLPGQHLGLGRKAGHEFLPDMETGILFSERDSLS